MQDRDTSHWVSCHLPAIYSMNANLGQGIEDEDDLPSSIRKQLEDAPVVDVPEMEDYISAPLLHSTPVDQQIALTLSATTNNLTSDNNDKKNILDENSTSNLGLAEFSHVAIRSKAAYAYLTKGTRQQQAHKIHIKKLQEKCNIGDFVGL
ncbi:unnamed protein product [Rotaria magnacalcarata]|uniref:Uncharacterized protein n=1 Tax=Rotaria magnacalcarata TaxID=392030 RepID=A0A815MYR0_9BILA|nr:unnamed protein product [Rotaria magnacalcarata]CAF1431000.1 unnamed protein product [Rotaria magnacalcarata]CAF2146564.1 unnamed protein product [Rotaria magnacalcarata]